MSREDDQQFSRLVREVKEKGERGMADSAAPVSSLIMDGCGNLYGITYGGGAYDFGTIFEFAADGTESVLYSFCSLNNCADGNWPAAGLVSEGKGTLFGTTTGGGEYGGGEVFEIPE